MLLDDGDVRYPKRIRVFGRDTFTGSDCACKRFGFSMQTG